MQKTIGILDTETGGFSTSKNGVCEIALLIVSEDLTEVVKEFSILIKPYTRADDTEELVSYKDDAMAVHGITIEELETEGVEVSEACQMVLDTLKENNVRTLMGHNINAFDVPKVEHLTNRFLGKDLKKYAKVCTLKLSREHLTAKDYKLETICEEYGIKQEQAHRALSDCYSTLGIARILHKENLLTS